MKTLNSYLIIVVLLTGLSMSCKKDHEKSPDPNTIHVTVRQGETYQKDLGRTGIEDGIRISRQADHFSVSKLQQDDSLHWIYVYEPAGSFTGTDEVKMIRTISPGGIPTDSVETHIIFSVTSGVN